MQVKSAEDIVQIKEGAQRLSAALHKVLQRVQPGVTGMELTKYAEELILSSGGKPAFKGYGDPPFPHALCVSVNSCVVHGVPTHTPFEEGDVIGFDMGMVFNGYYSDMARTVILDPASEREHELLRTAQEALDIAIQKIAPGVHIGDIGHAVQTFVEGRGFGIVRDLAGHGVGFALHEQPEVPNFGEVGNGPVLETGMVLAIEPMITMGDWQVQIAEDHWSVLSQDGSKTAHVEDMVLVTETGYSILTRQYETSRH